MDELDILMRDMRQLTQSLAIRDKLAENMAAFICNPSANNFQLLHAEMIRWQEWTQHLEQQ